ncbi:MAG TPA: hypothetical protein PKA82_10500 [Pyrinomonadaceae bacterium]|nr:hypothetical protein [Pyrinomonadaceae bacterium]
MHHGLKEGDFLIIQIEAGYVMLRVLGIDEGDSTVMHIAAYSDYYLDVESAEAAAANASTLGLSIKHVALTERAFEATQAAPIANTALTEVELAPLVAWRNGGREISDRSIRLLLGLR